jgi:hypothetical protein
MPPEAFGAGAGVGSGVGVDEIGAAPGLRGGSVMKPPEGAGEAGEDRFIGAPSCTAEKLAYPSIGGAKATLERSVENSAL